MGRAPGGHGPWASRDSRRGFGIRSLAWTLRKPRTSEAQARLGAGRKLVPGGWLLFPRDLGARRRLLQLRGCVFITFPSAGSAQCEAQPRPVQLRAVGLNVPGSGNEAREGAGATGQRLGLRSPRAFGGAGVVGVGSVSLSVVLRTPGPRGSGGRDTGLRSGPERWPKVSATVSLALWTTPRPPPRRRSRVTVTNAPLPAKGGEGPCSPSSTPSHAPQPILSGSKWASDK